MSSVSDRERVAHVVRRLSMGAHPDVVDQLADTDTAIARALDLNGAPPANGSGTDHGTANSHFLIGPR